MSPYAILAKHEVWGFPVGVKKKEYSVSSSFAAVSTFSTLIGTERGRVKHCVKKIQRNER